MRKIKRKKSRRILTPLLFIFNVLLWVSVIYLWTQDVDLPPQTSMSPQANMSPQISMPQQIRDNFIAASAASEHTHLHLYSHHALLVNLDTGEVLFDHNGRERAYPASVTKLMTILVGIEHATSDELIVYADFDTLFIEGASMACFVAGETRTLSEVLHASLLGSGADATSTLAYHVAASYQGFVDLMNETARRLGMHDTHFMNTSGLHHSNHYTTAYDIALLLDYALTHEYFREVFAAERYSFITSTGSEHEMYSTVAHHFSQASFDSGVVLCGMTGFTTPAGFSLASAASDGINEFALITFRAPGGSYSGLPAHFRDAVVIYDYFFAID